MTIITTYLTSYDTNTNLNIDYEFIEDETFTLLDIDNESDVSVALLKAGAKFCYWKRVMEILATQIDFSADGSSFKGSQLYDHAEKQLQISIEEFNDYSFVEGNDYLITDSTYNPYRITE